MCCCSARCVVAASLEVMWFLSSLERCTQVAAGNALVNQSSGDTRLFYSDSGSGIYFGRYSRSFSPVVLALRFDSRMSLATCEAIGQFFTEDATTLKVIVVCVILWLVKGFCGTNWWPPATVIVRCWCLVVSSIWKWPFEFTTRLRWLYLVVEIVIGLCLKGIVHDNSSPQASSLQARTSQDCHSVGQRVDILVILFDLVVVSMEIFRLVECW